MKWTIATITVVVLALAGMTPATAQDECGSTSFQITYNCNTDVCNSSVTVTQPILNPVWQYVESDEYCCGVDFVSYVPYTYCLFASLRDPKTLNNLKSALSTRGFLVANCNGDYFHFERDSESPDSLPRLAPHALNLTSRLGRGN